MGLRLEVCVDTAEGLAQAIAGGADRIELCAALALGGLTPSVGLMTLAARAGVPVMAMIRPRAGDFHWSEAEVGMMKAEIGAARAAGLAGVVLGALLPDGRLDQVVLQRLILAAQGMDLTLHRCFDLVPDLGQALEEAIALGFPRVLTSGGARTAPEGLPRIAGLVAQASGRISVMPGSGISAETAPMFRDLAIAEIHASCSVPAGVSAPLTAMGFDLPGARRTDAGRVRALRSALG